MIFNCPYCDIQLENNDYILESIGGYTMCPYCYEMMYVEPLKENKGEK